MITDKATLYILWESVYIPLTSIADPTKPWLEDQKCYIKASSIIQVGTNNIEVSAQQTNREGNIETLNKPQKLVLTMVYLYTGMCLPVRETPELVLELIKKEREKITGVIS